MAEYNANMSGHTRRANPALEWGLFSMAILFVLGFGGAILFGLYQWWYVRQTTFDELVRFPIPYALVIVVPLCIALVAGAVYLWLLSRRGRLRTRPMSVAVLASAFVAVFVISLVSVLFCFQYSDVISERLVAPYRLLAVDSREDLRIVLDDEGHQLTMIGPTVVYAGYDSTYVVAAVCEGSMSNLDLGYYYLDIAEAGQLRFPPEAVVGPLTSSDFERAKVTLGLPEFTVCYPDLHWLTDTRMNRPPPWRAILDGLRTASP